MNKKTRERFFLNEVAALYSCFPTGAIIDTERPDFLILTANEVIGIEVVDYVRGQKGEGSADRRNEVLWQEVANKARREFESNYAIPLMVHFSWRQGRHLKKADVPRLALSAAKAIARATPRDLFEHVRIARSELQDAPLYEFVSSITVTRVRNEKQALWAPVSAGFICVSGKEIEELVASHECKAQAYLQRCAKVWLLIVADGKYISSNAELSETFQLSRSPSLFSKVLFYNRVDGTVTTLVA
jgi:hypothetical protein